MPRIPTIIDKEDGTVIGVNLKRIAEMPYFLLTNNPANNIAVPGRQSSPPIVMSVSGEGPAQIHSFSAERHANVAATGAQLVYPNGGVDVARVFLQIQDGQSIRGLMNGAAHIDTIFGRYANGAATIAGAVFAASIVTVTTAAAHGFGIGQMVSISGVTPNGYNGQFIILSVPSTITFTYRLGTDPGAFVAGGTAAVWARPYPLPEALYIDEQRHVTATITDLAGPFPAALDRNNIRLNMHTQRLLTRQVDLNLSRVRARMEKRQYMALPYFYILDNGNSVIAAAGGTNTETITIGQDHHFEIFQITAVSNGPFSINIVNTSTGESLVDGPLGSNFNVPSGVSIGNASFPLRFHEPRFIELRSKLIVTLTDLSNAANNTIWLTLGGRALADKMWI